MTEHQKTPFELSSDARAVDRFREDEQAALAGTQLLSPETDAAARERWSRSPNRKKSKMMGELAAADPARFLELVQQLPHVIQDIFFQYYLLGRAQEHIGQTLEMSQTAVWQTLSLGIDGVCALIQGKPLPDAVAEFKHDCKKTLCFKEPGTLGQFELRVDDDTLELNFAPQTTEGAIQKE